MAAMDSLFPELSRITTTSLPEVVWEDDPTTTKRMEHFLNSALCVIHNLSKSTKHREKFRTPEMRKILDIYKGSPSSQRRMFSLLAISYMADPKIDMSLLEDKYGAISDLADCLDKSLIPGNSTGFSLQELVEGMANLAVHPFNKDQIIDNSLHLFYTILESNINKNLTCYVRHVLDRWGFSDVGSTTGSEQCQREKEIQIKSEQHQDDDANKSVDNMQMLDNLHCVLSECDSFGTNDVLEIIGAVKLIVSDKTSGRQNVLQHMAMHEWPGLLIRIISDVWKPNKEVYTDEILWSILTDTIDTMTTYSDADVECADILIEHGALAIMQEIADAYYQHFKQKTITLNDKVSEYRGTNSGELDADDNRQSKDPTKTNIPCGQSGTDRHQSTGPTQNNIPSGQQGADGHQSMGTTQSNIPSCQQGADGHQSMGPTQTNIPRGHQGADGHQSMGTTQTNIPSGQQGADGHQSMGPTQTNIPSGQQGADGHQSMGPTQTNIPSGQQGADGHQSMGPTQTSIPSGQQGAEGHQSIGPTQTNSCQQGADERQSMGPTQTNINNKSSSEISQTRESTESGASYTLKPVSQYACVNEDSTIAYRKNSDVMFNRAVFVSNEPVESSKLFELNIDKIDVRHNGSMELGMCMYNEFPEEIYYEGSGFGKGSGFWFLRENDLWKDFTMIGGGYKLNLRSIRVNDRVGLVRHSDGTMGFLYNGQYQGIAFRNVPGGIYGLVATTGQCVQVSITEDAGRTFEQETAAGTPNAPFESFSIKTAGTDSVSVSRLRVPYGLDFTDEEKHPEMSKVYQETDDTICNAYVETEKNVLTPMYNINQRSSKGYLNEIDLRDVLKMCIVLYNFHHDPSTRVDPVSRDPMKFITTSVKMYGKMLKCFQRNNLPPKATDTLPKRRQQIFDAVRPCFDNIQDMSGIVWTGSTSEGFAIADNSGPGTPYVDDEMDLMIPLAMATEGSQRSTCEDVAIDKQTFRGGFNEFEANSKEMTDIKKESLVTELENIGKCQQSEECPHFIWRPSCHPGYVFIVVPESMQSYISNSFFKYICALSKSHSGGTDLFLTRSKLLAIQEEYTRGRLSVVQSNITQVRHDEEGQFKGKLRLVQEGPVQTISVRYESKEPSGSVLEFDQTVDVAIALNGVNWPTIATPWMSRKRLWPEQFVVDKIIKDGYHIVPKYYPGGSGVDLEWRLSFSLAERTLARTFTDTQRNCYMVFKKLWRKYLKVPKVLSSYHIKTTMFWLCERSSSSDWMESNVGDRFLDLQNFLILFLQRNNVPNFFIPENNMISNVHPADVNEILVKAQDIRRRQQYYLRDLVVPSTSFNFTSW